MREPMFLPPVEQGGWPEQLIPGDYYQSVLGDYWEVGPKGYWIKKGGDDKAPPPSLTPPPA